MNQAYSYIRWSTDIQKLGDSERRQLEKSREYAKEHNLELIEEMSDSGISAFRGKMLPRGNWHLFLPQSETRKSKKVLICWSKISTAYHAKTL
jgi:DNA invertase Pin-like site-specific DNA recombinase